MKTFLATAVALSLTCGLAAQTAPQPVTLADSVTVIGTGRASVVPDRFSFTVGVQTVGRTVDEAVSENNRRTAAVIAALKKGGAADADIQTSQFNIWPQQDHRPGELPRILGYQVNNSVTVRSRKVADAGKLLGVAISQGVNTSSGIQFEVSDPALGREAGLRAAFNDARAKAVLLAQSAGRSVGRTIYISEGVQQAPPPMPYQRAMVMEAQASADVPVESGTQETTYQVTVIFALQ